MGTLLVVCWLRLCASNAGDVGLILGWVTIKSHVLQNVAKEKEKVHKRLSYYDSNLGKWMWIWTKTGRKHTHTKKQRIFVHLFLHQLQTISKIQKGEVGIRTPKLVCLCLLPTLTPPLPSQSLQQILYSGWLPYFHNGFIINRRK